MSQPRVALFLDFENLYATLKRRTKGPEHPYGLSPKLDFERLVAYIEEHYGTLAPEDFIVVANFSHYNPQIGGLNRVATVINAQSFMHPRVRRQRQRSPGKRWVIQNYADMRLAFELGRHVSTRPADIYILGSGDAAFTALGRTLDEMGFAVVFMVADLNSPSTDANIREEFAVFDFLSTQEVREEPEPEPEPEPIAREPANQVAHLVGELRRAFRCGIPVALVRALWPGEDWDAALRQARGRGRVDLWESPEGVPCISLREERLFDKVRPLSVRPEVAETARVLDAVRRRAAQAPADADRVYWRRALREDLGLSSKEAKRMLEHLLQARILEDGFMNRPQISLAAAQNLAQRLKKPR